MNAARTLTFDLTPEQREALQQCANKTADGDLRLPDGTYRAWNAGFVPCSEPLELSYRAWNARFVACDAPV